MREHYVTIGEIFRQGLLKNADGKPYANKGTISVIVNRSEYLKMRTPYGIAKVLSKKQIDELNKRFDEPPIDV